MTIQRFNQWSYVALVAFSLWAISYGPAPTASHVLGFLSIVGGIAQLFLWWRHASGRGHLKVAIVTLIYGVGFYALPRLRL